MPVDLVLSRTAATGVLSALVAESWLEWEPDVEAILPLTDLCRNEVLTRPKNHQITNHYTP